MSRAAAARRGAAAAGCTRRRVNRCYRGDTLNAAVPMAAAPAAADSSRILNQILGKEELQVFLRMDALQFLPVKALPEVPK